MKKYKIGDKLMITELNTTSFFNGIHFVITGFKSTGQVRCEFISPKPKEWKWEFFHLYEYSVNHCTVPSNIGNSTLFKALTELDSDEEAV